MNWGQVKVTRTHRTRERALRVAIDQFLRRSGGDPTIRAHHRLLKVQIGREGEDGHLIGDIGRVLSERRSGGRERNGQDRNCEGPPRI